MKNIGINEVEHSLKNQRNIILEPYYMENIGKGGLGVEVWVNGEKQTRGSVDNPTKQLFKLILRSRDSGIFHVKIVVKEGSLRIGERDAIGVYPAMYDVVEGYVSLRQFNFINWLQNPSKDPSELLNAGDTFEYDHLVPKGPSYWNLHFNKDKHREEFIRTKTICDSTLDNTLLNPMFDYFCDDAGIDRDSLTNKILHETN